MNIKINSDVVYCPRCHAEATDLGCGNYVCPECGLHFAV